MSTKQQLLNMYTHSNRYLLQLSITALQLQMLFIIYSTLYLWTFQNKLFASISGTSLIFFELCFQLLEFCNLRINLNSKCIIPSKRSILTEVKLITLNCTCIYI